MIAALTIAFSVAVATASSALTAHPRLIATSDIINKLKDSIASGDPTIVRYEQGLIKHVDGILPLPPVVPPPPGATGILEQVREVIDRLVTLSLAYQLTANTTYSDRALKELTNITSWSTWNQVQHTLDTGEAIAGVSMAIDWLWDVIPASERDGYITALVIKGLEPMWSAFLTRPTWSWWAFNPINWNCVCSGGTMLGALLLADYPGAPDYVTNGSLLAYASDSFRVCASDYSSDNGSYWEGSMYFGYQSLYYVLAAAALESCGAGGANGLDAIPGGNETARWEQQSQGVANALVSTGTKIVEGKAVATGGQSQAKYFNWADAEEGGVNLAHAFWFARRYQDSATTAWLQAQYDPDLVPGVDVSQLAWMQTALLMVFYPGLPPVSPGDRSALPLSAMYPGNALAYSRSSWSDPQASFWAAKGGNTTYNHGDLDIGTYVLDLQGARFVSDLGADSYSLPDYFGKARWQYYRKNTHGHNVPMFDGRNQTFAPYHNPISAWYAPGDGNAIAVIDSTQVYEGLASLNRTFVFMPSDGTRAPQLTVNDRFVYKPGFAPGNLTIAVHTYGNVTLGPEPLSATVTVDGVTARYYLADPKPCAGATLTATAVRLAPPQTPTDGLTRLDVVVPSPAASGCTMVTTAWQVMA